MHFAISCPPLPGHLNPFCVLGRELVRRGHKATIFSVADAQSMVQNESLPFVAVATERFPPGSLVATLQELKRQQGLRSVVFVIREANAILRSILESAPAIFQRESVDFVLADQNEPASASVAEHLGIPFASICTSLPLNREPAIPPSFVGWSYGTDRKSKIRNKLGYGVSDLLTRRLQATLNEFRKTWGLKALHSPDDSFSKWAQIAQMPAEFDYPRRGLPPHFHYTGPWIDDVFENSAANGFPFERLDGRPVLYVSFGTLQSSNNHQFAVVADACTGFPVQVVISAGTATGGAELPALPGNHLVVPFAPQIKLLKRAALTITHAGMNTTMHALKFGCPLIAIPLAHDQPAIAARVARAGVGLVIPRSKLTVANLRAAIEKILSGDGKWPLEARRMQEAIEAAGGVQRAADIIESQSLSCGH